MKVNDKDKEMKNDRLIKYYYGSFRLFIIVLISFNISPYNIIKDKFYKYIFDNELLSLYISSYRWIAHIYFGTIGAIINVKLLSFNKNIILGIFYIYFLLILLNNLFFIY